MICLSCPDTSISDIHCSLALYPSMIEASTHHMTVLTCYVCLLQMEVREDCCSVCRRSGELLMCDVCSLVYHLQCLNPPLSAVPVGLWSCPKCQVHLQLT